MSGDREPDRLTTEQFASWWRQTGEHELRQVLFWRWDPIGVSEYFPNTADEYDGYAPQIAHALRGEASDEELAQLILGLEHDAMGLPSRPEDDRVPSLVALLRLWFENSQSSWRDFGPVRR